MTQFTLADSLRNISGYNLNHFLLEYLKKIYYFYGYSITNELVINIYKALYINKCRQTLNNLHMFIQTQYNRNLNYNNNNNYYNYDDVHTIYQIQNLIIK